MTKNKQIAILTSNDSEKPGFVAELLVQVAEDKNVMCSVIDVTEAWISQNDLEKGTLTVSNIDGNDTEVEFDISETVCIVRMGALETQVGMALVHTFETAGAFMINTSDCMHTCHNKMSSFISFQRDNIPVPKTAIVPNAKSLESAHKDIGGKFPVIIKTITGTQGIGVAIVHDQQSLLSVIQALWKYDAQIIIQEKLEIDYDVRTLVFNGKILACTKRTRPENDFRSNRHRGAKTSPYELSEKEQEIVLAAARSVGGYFVGVDHAIVDEEIYILECNGSPGMESNFAQYDISKTNSDENQFLGKSTAKAIVQSMIDHIIDTKHTRHSFNMEAGYIETIEIEDLGVIRAKFDTGNGTKASMLTVDKIRMKDDIVLWEMDGKQFESKLEGFSFPEHINKMDQRPIVNVNVYFNNKYYTDVPIGLTTQNGRSMMLVNRDLLTRFKVNVNPNKKFVLSDWSERNLREETL